MQHKSLITGESVCNNCHKSIGWSMNISDPEVRIIGGFINSQEAGNDLEINIQCNHCNKINKIYDKYIVANQ